MLLGKTIVVTGISSGIGARVGELALSLGAEVIGLDVNPPASPLGAFVEVDIAAPSAAAEVAGRLPLRIALTQALAPRLREGGAVVNVASIAGYGWRAGLARAKAFVAAAGGAEIPALLARHEVAEAEGYPLSKELLLLWTQLAAHQPLFKDRGVRVNAVSPGPVTTPILGQFRTIFGDPRVDDDIARVGRAGSPADIAPAVAFLCSDGARWINGANLPVDGGLEASINASVLGF
jgi:NAD(P)-dependent dehydrogenase (short-subunit alcohol dehydrogenase family)